MKFIVSKKLLTLREEGKEQREKLEVKLREVEPGSVVEISFEKVEALGGSATDEFLGKLLTSRRVGDIPDVAFVLTGLNADTAFEVNLVLSNRGAAVVSIAASGVELLGGDDYLKTTFDIASTAGEFNTSDLAAKLGVTLQNLNNRLKRLVSDGALLRTRDTSASGKQFVYRVPMPA
jgi:hypothetical protein